MMVYFFPRRRKMSEYDCDTCKDTGIVYILDNGNALKMFCENCDNEVMTDDECEALSIEDDTTNLLTSIM